MRRKVAPPSGNASRKAPRKQQQSQYYPLSEWFKMALDNEDISEIESDQLAQLVDLLKEERDHLIGSGQNVEKADAAFRRVKEMHDIRVKTDAQEARQNELSERMEYAKKELHNLEETISIQEKNMNYELSRQVQELEEKHRQEIEALTDEWESPAVRRRYNRTSQHLRELRIQEIKLLNAHRYDEMNIVKREADALEAKEREETQRKLEQDYETRLQCLRTKQEEEMAKLIHIQDIQKDKYEVAKVHDLRIAHQRIKNLDLEVEVAKDPEKVWTRFHRMESLELGKRAKPRSARKAPKKTFRSQDYNTLSLPPLTDRRPRKKQDLAETLSSARVRPKYSWL